MIVVTMLLLVETIVAIVVHEIINSNFVIGVNY